MDVMQSIQRMLPHLEDGYLNELVTHCAGIGLQHWNKGENLFVEHRTFQSLVIIKTGLVRSFYLDDDTEINLRFLCDGSLAVPFAAVAQAFCADHAALVSSETVQCVTAVSGYVLPISLLVNQQRSAPWERLRTELSARHYLSMEQRLRMIQHQRAIERYKRFLQWMPEPIVRQMPNIHVASYLGMSAEALSRIKQQFSPD